MTIVEVKVPQLSESVSEATMLEWKKKLGETVFQDEILIELETDKIVLEVPAPTSGLLIKMLKNNGETVTTDQVIGMIDTEKCTHKSNDTETKHEVPPPPAYTRTSSDKFASPVASKLMAEKGISSVYIVGSGRSGRITKDDVLSEGRLKIKYSNETEEISESETKTSSFYLDGRSEHRAPMSRLRVRIAERLVKSQQTSAILTTFNEVNMKQVIDLRTKYKDRFEKEHGVKLGFMSFFVKAAIYALKKFPLINASIDGSDIIYHEYFDIGIAVSSPRGLVVPILRNANQLGLAEIEKKIAEFSQKSKDGKLSIDEITGGTFSISNGGVFGSMLSTPIINPPQSAILGVHAMKDRPIVENGQILIRPINYLALSYDHRIIDGREAVLFLVMIKEVLEDPARLLLDL